MTNVASVLFDLVWNPAIVQYQSGALGPFLGSGGAQAQLTLPTGQNLAAANAAGRLPVTVNIVPATTGVSGTGIVCTLNFRAVAAGIAGLSFEANGVLTPFPSSPIPGIIFTAGTVRVVL